MVEVIAGESHLFLRTNKNYYFAYGSNSLHQLGLPDIQRVDSPLHFALKSKTKIEKLFCGSNSTWAIDQNKDIYGWGLN